MQYLQISEFFSDLWLHNKYAHWDINYNKLLCVLKWQLHKSNLFYCPQENPNEKFLNLETRKEEQKRLYSSRFTLQIIINSLFLLLQTHFGIILKIKCMENIDLAKLTQNLDHGNIFNMKILWMIPIRDVCQKSKFNHLC